MHWFAFTMSLRGLVSNFWFMWDSLWIRAVFFTLAVGLEGLYSLKWMDIVNFNLKENFKSLIGF